MGFSDESLKALSAKLSEKHVRVRERNGMRLAYVEGWHTIAEANRIFGYDAWDRETVSIKCVGETCRTGNHSCTYLAKVRVSVRAGEVTVSREGMGAGHGYAARAGEAHESAVKEAETDAMKRALVTFGNPFGLALYDEEKKGLRRSRRGPAPELATLPWVLAGEAGERQSAYARPIDYLAALRRRVDGLKSAARLEAFVAHNRKMLDKLLWHQPDLRSGSGIHYVSLLDKYAARKLEMMQAAEQQAGEEVGGGPPPSQEDGSGANSTDATKRIRDKGHLEYVATLPCLVCGRSPAQAHHVRYAQPRAMGLKVSDEWTVPLCNLHHRALHDNGDEQEWWGRHNIDPLAAARGLWDKRRAA